MVLIAPNSHILYFEFGSGFLFLETPFTQVVMGKNTLSLWLEILREKIIPEFTLICSDHHKKEIYNSSSVFAKTLPVFPNINFGKSNGAGLVTLLCFIMWMDPQHSDPQIGNVSEKNKF